MRTLRPCRPDDSAMIAHVINEAARRYEGAIPDDCWRWPYMELDELEREIADGVAFSGIWLDGALTAVMGLQDRGDVVLIRHAYVRPRAQGAGLGGQLLGRLCGPVRTPILVGAWAAADWAIAFYERRGFVRAAPEATPGLLAAHWAVPPRQARASVVLARTAAI